MKRMYFLFLSIVILASCNRATQQEPTDVTQNIKKTRVYIPNNKYIVDPPIYNCPNKGGNCVPNPIVVKPELQYILECNDANTINQYFNTDEWHDGLPDLVNDTNFVELMTSTTVNINTITTSSKRVYFIGNTSIVNASNAIYILTFPL